MFQFIVQSTSMEIKMKIHYKFNNYYKNSSKKHEKFEKGESKDEN